MMVLRILQISFIVLVVLKKNLKCTNADLRLSIYVREKQYSKNFALILRILKLFTREICIFLKVSEYPFKQNKNALKNIKVLLYTHFYNNSLNVLRPTFFNICNLSLSHFPNIRKMGQRLTTFPTL